MPMTRDDLIRRMVDKQGHIPYKIMCDSVKYLIEEMAHALRSRSRIEVRGFGSFAVRSRAPGLARNPKTGVLVQTQQRFTVHFKPGKELRERVDNAVCDVN